MAKLLLVLLALSTACNDTIAPTGPFMNLYKYFEQLPTYESWVSTYKLCLTNSTPGFSFSLGEHKDLDAYDQTLKIENLTIE